MRTKLSSKLLTRSKPFLIPTLVFFVSALAYLQYGFDGSLAGDDAQYMYSAQQMIRGVPIYSSIWIAKGPVMPMIAGAGVFAASLLGTDDLLTVRVLFLVISCLTAVAVYLLGDSLFRSRRIGVLSALIFIGFLGFGKHACSGPRPKTPMLLFVVLCLWLLTRRRWFWAGIFSSLAVLTWQPAGVYVVATSLFAFIWSDAGSKRRRNLATAMAGVLLPLLAVSIYFLVMGNFPQFMEGFILYHLRYRGVAESRSTYTLYKHFWLPIRAIFNGYPTSAPFIFFGFLMMGGLYAWRFRIQRSVAKMIFTDRFAPLLLTFPAPIIWSLLDFQGYPDFYIFLPYVAIGSAWLTHLALEKFAEVVESGARAQTTSFLVTCGILVALAVGSYGTIAETGLTDQRKWALEIEQTYLQGPDARLWAIGRAQELVLLHRTNPSQYIWLGDAITNLMEDVVPGGFAGWIAQLEEYDPDVVTWGPHTPQSKRALLTEWLKPRYVRKNVGDWNIFVRREPKQ